MKTNKVETTSFSVHECDICKKETTFFHNCYFCNKELCSSCALSRAGRFSSPADPFNDWKNLYCPNCWDDGDIYRKAMVLESKIYQKKLTELRLKWRKKEIL